MSTDVRINEKQFVTALIVLAFGTWFSSVLITRYSADLVFFFTATKQNAEVIEVSTERKVVSDLSGSRYTEVSVDMLLRSAYGSQYVAESFSGSAEAAIAFETSRNALKGTVVEMYLSKRTPMHFALQLEFPLLRLSAILISLLVLVIPWVWAIVRYAYEQFLQLKA